MQYTWITLRLFQAVDSHSGYDFPWSLNKLIPFWGGAEKHDFHHQCKSPLPSLRCTRH